MKKCEGFTKLAPTIFFILFNILSSILLGLALKTLPLSVSYPIWVGVGAVETVLLDLLSLKKLACIIVILIGIIGVKIV